jgi:two-component system sensor histidine kinase SenX3
MPLTAIDAGALAVGVGAVAGSAAVVTTSVRRRHRMERRLGAVAAGLSLGEAGATGPGAPMLAWARPSVAPSAAIAPASADSPTPPVAPGSPVDDAVARIEEALTGQVAARRSAEVVMNRFQEALSAVPHGVVVCDEQGVVVYRNEAGAVFAGARHGEALAELAVTELLAGALSGNGTARVGDHLEQHLELYGPPRRTLLISARPLFPAGEILGAVAIIEDISERRRLDAVRRDFVANVSHELKTPVGALGILAETMQAEDDPAVSRRLAERMHLEAFRVARIIDDLLDLSRIESEEAPVREPVAVHLVVAEAVERIRPLAEHRQITIEMSEAPPRINVVGDRRQLVSALHNLLENAVKYSVDGSAVQVMARAVARPTERASQQGTWVEIDVRDRGIGIPSRDLERIFERFYRVDRARSRETGGTGLGLAIVRHVATNHRGEVQVVSREGEGSTFTLRLPAGAGADPNCGQPNRQRAR